MAWGNSARPNADAKLQANRAIDVLIMRCEHASTIVAARWRAGRISAR